MSKGVVVVELRPLLDAEQHPPFHDEASRLQHAPVDQPPRPRRAGGCDPVPAHQARAQKVRGEPEDPNPVAVLGAESQGPLRLADLDPHAGTVRAQGQQIPHREVLELRQNPVGAVHAEAEEVLDSMSGDGSSSSPGIARCASPAVAPQVRYHRRTGGE
jgi:hypothetical protein